MYESDAPGSQQGTGTAVVCFVKAWARAYASLLPGAIVAGALLAVALHGWSLYLGPVYEARALVQAEPAAPGDATFFRTEARLARELSAGARVSWIPETSLIEFAVRGPDAQTASGTANAFAAAFASRSQAYVPHFGQPPTEPTNPARRDAIILFLTTIAAAAFVAAATTVLDPALPPPREAARVLGAGVIGVLPALAGWRGAHDWRVDPGDAEREPFHEAVRRLRAFVTAADSPSPRSVLITSAAPAEGKSTTAAHLAAGFARQGRKTLLIEADLRRPTLHEKLGVRAEAGLASLLESASSWRHLTVTPPAIPDLDLLAAGRAIRWPGDRLATVVERIVQDAAHDYDVVVIDSPPLLGCPESMELATLASRTVLVTNPSISTRRAAREAVDTLRTLGARLAGVVINQAPPSALSHLAYYGPSPTSPCPSPGVSRGPTARPCSSSTGDAREHAAVS